MHIFALAFAGLIGSFHDDILYTVQDIRMTNIRSFCIPANENFRNKKGDSLWNRLTNASQNQDYSPR